MDEMIHTKLAPPMWMGNQIRRDLLLARLDVALERRLTLIQAPAGYGKTSLLSQWKERFDPANVLVAWLTLERDDSDLRRLTRYIALALEGAGPHDMTGDEGDRMAASLPPRAAVSAIVNRLAQEKRTVVLILDDFHRAESPEVDAFVRSLIQLAPPNCHFIVASRDYPWLGQSILAAEEQLVELTADDLKFSSHEAEALLARALDGSVGEGLAGDDVRSIVERTEGWPIALQLASLSLKRGADHRRLVEQFRGPSSELARYLSEQVLMTMPEETREIVIRTALLDRLTGDAVNLLCDRQDGWMVLERLEEQGVFLTPLTPERQAYRYHQLFAEHLRERLARRDSAQFRALHRRVAAWFAERGETAEAVSHAIQADDDAMLATILEDAGGWRLIPLGHQAMIQRGLEKLPAAIVAVRPRLALARVYLEIKRGELTTARADYDSFAAAATDLSPDQMTEIRVVGDVLADYENEPVTLDDLLSREALLRTLPSNDHLVFANVSETLGAKYFEGGWLERALEPTLAAREHYQAMGSLYSDVFTRFLEARIRHAQGRVKDATAILTATRLEIGSGFGDRSDLAANCAAFEAELLYEQDQPAAAMALLDWAVPHMEQSDGWTDVYAAAYFTAAHALAADGSVESAQEMIARARRLASRRRLRQLDLLAGLCELDLLIQHGEDSAAAHVAADAIDLNALAQASEADITVHRPVVTAASLCRIRLALLDGEHEAALTELTDLRRWATQHGAGRLLIDVNILLAYAHRTAGDAAQARACFDDAVGSAMFQGIARPFIDARRFAEPLLNETLGGTGQLDRFRGQFLKGIARTLASRPATGPAPGLLSDAESAILEHLGFGYSNKEIARLIGMSPDTVKYRLKSVFKKIGVHKRRDAVRVLRERGFISSSGTSLAD
ncbi:helix-turn-helix transcriptional regulator [Sphingomonas sp. LT1P40]|uniref:helix-turn-helix transcriptional regulator n=1 Tax=Alteristakelama amylovorans TaxID=3096166 RepID=UPI002FCC7DAC